MTDLRKKDPIEICVPFQAIIIGMILSAIVFGMLGIAFRHYIPIGG